MKNPLIILHLEDDPNDALLVLATLEAEGIACELRRVETRADFIKTLESGEIDLILSDFSLPTFDGFAALEIVRDRWPSIPLIFVSGTLGEEQAIDSLKRGATDYVLKTRLSRLPPAVRRAAQELEAEGERQQLEAQFVEAQKMEVVGQLAGGVAHDFNNILGVIMGYSSLMLAEVEAGCFLHKCAEEIQQAAERAVALTRQLLVFSRKQTTNLVVLDLNHVVEHTDKILRRLIDENIEMTIATDSEIGHIKADAGHLGQILMNLVVNARDAMPHGGRLTIRTSNIALDEAALRTNPEAKPGDYVLLSVSDTGTGMTNEVKARLFEAFFTTKPKGQGTGLGLATCQTIARQCGGIITVESALGQGTTFGIYFPRVEEPLETVVGSHHDNVPLRRGTETLLLVEDEPSVRHLANNVLEAEGYTVLRANNGQEGLNLARAHRGTPISLVITDVIMPQMGGKVMAEWLQATYPEIKVLFTSGYTDDAIGEHGVLDPGVAFLPKPYTPATLTRKVREMLDAK